MGSLLPTIISLCAGLVIGVIGFFLKRTISRVDDNAAAIQNIHNNYVVQDDHNDDIAECRADIKQIKEDYITRDDFYREQSKTERKLDHIMDNTDRKLDRVMEILLELERRK